MSQTTDPPDGGTPEVKKNIRRTGLGGRPKGAKAKGPRAPQIRSQLAIKRMDEAGIDPMQELMNLYKVVSNDAVLARPRFEDVKGEDGKTIEVMRGNPEHYHWAVDRAIHALLGLMPYKYPKYAPIDRAGLAVAQTQVNVSVTDARQQLIALVTGEVDRVRKLAATAGSAPAPQPAV